VFGQFNKLKPKQRDKSEDQVCGIHRRKGTSKKDRQNTMQFDVKSPNEPLERNKQHPQVSGARMAQTPLKLNQTSYS
jgi:hypothetical protein